MPSNNCSEPLRPLQATADAPDIEFPQTSISLYIRLDAKNEVQCVEVSDDWTAQELLEAITSYLHSIDYFPSLEPWVSDICLDDGNLMPLTRLLTFRKESQTDLLVRDVLFGGEHLTVHVLSRHHKHVWNCQLSQWEALLREDINPDLSTALFSDRELEMAAMRLRYIRFRNDQLKLSANDEKNLTAVVFVGTEHTRMGIVKRYCYGSNRHSGTVEFMEGITCIVRDTTGQERCLTYRALRGIWVEDDPQLSNYEEYIGIKCTA